MTSSSLGRLLAVALSLLLSGLAWAGLGEHENAIAGTRMQMRAHHAVQRKSQYTVHDLIATDGSRVRQYAAVDGRIFAVSWHTLYKPDMAGMLGSAFPAFSEGLKSEGRQAGIRRQYRQEAADLVVHSTGHMNVYSGFAYKPSLFPVGLDPKSMDLG